MRSARRSAPAAGPRPSARRGARRAGRCSARACSSAVIVRCLANDRGCRQASSPVSSATASDLALGRRGPRRGGRPAAGPASSRWCRSADTGSGGTRSTQRRSMSGAVGGSGAITSRSSMQPVDRAAAQRLVRPRRWRARRTSASSCSWKSSSFANAPAGLEVALHEALQPLDARPWPADRAARRSASRPAAAPQNAANSSVGRPPRACMPGLAIPDQRLAAARPATTGSAAIPNSRSGGLLGEDQRAGAGARVAQARDDDPAAAGLAVPDRDLRARLPEIELADLARPIDRPLKRPRRRREQRPDLAQVVIDDRLAAREAQRLDQLADPLTPGSFGSLAQQPMDLVLERIELRPRRRPPIARRPARCATPAGPCCDDSPVRRASSLIDTPRTKCSRRSSAHCSTPTNPFLPASTQRRTERGSTPPRTPPPHAPGGQISTGGGGSVFTRRRHSSRATRSFGDRAVPVHPEISASRTDRPLQDKLLATPRRIGISVRSATTCSSTCGHAPSRGRPADERATPLG